MFLITRWFGTFLLDEKEIKKNILFPKDEKEIQKRLKKIDENKILPAEKRIVKNIDKKDIIVEDKRSIELGKYEPDDPFFKKIDLNPKDFGFSNNLIQKVSILLSKEKTKDSLEKVDLQIVQMINTLDDFIQTLNLLNERYESWKEIKKSEERMKPLKKSISVINKEIDNISSSESGINIEFL